MIRRSSVPLTVVLAVFPILAQGQSPPQSDPQALAFAAQSISAMTGGTAISDATLTGSVTWNVGSSDTGTATLKALGTGESRMDLTFKAGTRTEVRDAQTGISLGQWINPDNTSGSFAFQNCQTDAAWFFPPLGSLAAVPNVVLSYIGQETRNGETVQHIQAYVYQTNPSVGFSPQQLSAMDFYLDAMTYLPVAVAFNAHPDDGSTANILTEVDFSNYQVVGGVLVPMHIQRYLQGNLLLDLTVATATFNTGLPLSDFTVNSAHH